MISGATSIPQYQSPSTAMPAVSPSTGAPAPVAAPVVANAPTSSPTSTPASPVQSQGIGGIFGAIGHFFGAIFGAIGGFFHRLFGGGGSSSQLTPTEQALATQYNLLATVANVQAFENEQQQYQQLGCLGPGSSNTQAITQLQQGLAQLGYSVSVDGQYDTATQNAVIKFKQDNGLHQSYQLANGTWAVNAWLDPNCYNTLKAKIQAIASGSSSSSGSTTSSNSSTASPPVSSSTDWQAIAQQDGLLSTQANVDAYLAELAGYQTDGALTPASTDSASITQLQQALTKLGFSVPTTGEYDSATEQAVVAFKQAHSLHQTYQMADGSWAVNPVADPQTLTLINQLIGSTTTS